MINNGCQSLESFIHIMHVHAAYQPAWSSARTGSPGVRKPLPPALRPGVTSWWLIPSAEFSKSCLSNLRVETGFLHLAVCFPLPWCNGSGLGVVEKSGRGAPRLPLEWGRWWWWTRRCWGNPFSDRGLVFGAASQKNRRGVPLMIMDGKWLVASKW